MPIYTHEDFEPVEILIDVFLTAREDKKLADFGLTCENIALKRTDIQQLSTKRWFMNDQLHAILHIKFRDFIRMIDGKTIYAALIIIVGEVYLGFALHGKV